jgi:hypothetical protein
MLKQALFSPGQPAVGRAGAKESPELGEWE